MEERQTTIFEDQDFYTLDSAKDYLRDNIEKGCICPCCDRSIKKHKRKFNSGMAHFLIILYKYHIHIENYDWVHYKKLIKFSGGVFVGDYSTIKFWGLIEKKDEDIEDTTKKSSGLIKITEDGIKFVKGETSILKHVFILRNKLEYFSKEFTSIHEALSDDFDYQELMKS